MNDLSVPLPPLSTHDTAPPGHAATGTPATGTPATGTASAVIAARETAPTSLRLLEIVRGELYRTVDERDQLNALVDAQAQEIAALRAMVRTLQKQVGSQEEEIEELSGILTEWETGRRTPIHAPNVTASNETDAEPLEESGETLTIRPLTPIPRWMKNVYN